MKVKVAKKRAMALILAMVLAFGTVLVVLLSSLTAHAAETATITGTVNVRFDTNSRSLIGTYQGDTAVNSSNFSWFSGSAQVGTGFSYVPAEGGTYTLRVYATAGNAKSAYVESAGVTLYKISTDSYVSLNARLGVYLPGERVTATASVTDGATVTNWTASCGGIALPSSGNRVNFNMPKSNFTLTCDVSNMYRIKIEGGKASKYTAKEGEEITIAASDVPSRKFSMWVCTGVSVLDATQTVTSFTMPASDVIVKATYADDSSSEQTDPSSDTSKDTTNTVAFSDPTRVKYSVLRSNNYDVKLYHATLGPNYDKIFKMARGTDSLVTNYFMLVINGNQNIMETPGPVTICLTIPEDLQKQGRNWRMICLSRNNWAYSFPDTDSDVSTITFSPDRFCAFAMAFNDTPVVVEPTVTVAEAEAARQDAYRQGLEQGANNGYNEGYNEGYNAGYNEGASSSVPVSDGTNTGSGEASSIMPASGSETTGQTSSDTSGGEQKTPEPLTGGMVDKVEAQYGTSTSGTLAPLEL